MKFAPTTIEGVLVFTPTPFRDDRGFFSRTFDSDVAREAGIDPDSFVQDSQSRSHLGVLRGLHVRLGAGEAKLVRCSYGAILDVVVDLRPSSPTFLTVETFALDADAHRSVYIPAGCGHGWQALTEPADVCYRIDRGHDPSEDLTIVVGRPGHRRAVAAARRGHERQGPQRSLVRVGAAPPRLTPVTSMINKLRPRREVVLGPVRLKEGVLLLRSPRLRDAPAWSAARLANRQWLERAFPAWGDDWPAEQSPTAWVARWWHLQTLRRTHDARPFVLVLDGELIGELGIDAVDTDSGGGEASVWMVRDHGSAGVMNVASLLLIQHTFGGAGAMDRLISPVATTSRKGRAPGLTAVGFDIEATLPRPVGRGEAVDHDIWILHNSPAVRTKADQALAAMTRGERPPPVPQESRLPSAHEARALAPAVLRAAVRGVRGLVQSATARRGAAPADPLLTATADVGTATATIRPRAGAGDPVALVAAVLRKADDVATWAPGSRWVEVRLTPSLDAVGDALAGHGFEHVATYRGNPDGPRRWTGEHVWSRAVDS